MQKIKWSTFKESEQMLDFLNESFPKGSSLEKLVAVMVESGAAFIDGSDKVYFRYSSKANLFVKTVWIITVETSESRITKIKVKKNFTGL